AASCSRFGSADATARVVAKSSACRSSTREPRADVAIRAPIDASEAATMASATSTSMMVKPASRLLKNATRNNFNTSRQPVDAELVARAHTCEHNGAATRHPRRQKTDGRKRGPMVAKLR